MEKVNNDKEYGSWYSKYHDRLANDTETKNLFDKYEKRFGCPPFGNEELGACVYMEYEELIEKVKICLEKNINMVHLEIPDYDELLDQGTLF